MLLLPPCTVHYQVSCLCFYHPTYHAISQVHTFVALHSPVPTSLKIRRLAAPPAPQRVHELVYEDGGSAWVGHAGV